MHETSQNKLVQLIPKLGIEYYYDDGTPLYFTRDGRAGSQFKAKKVADEFADYLEWYYEENPDAPVRGNCTALPYMFNFGLSSVASKSSFPRNSSRI